MRQDAVEEHCFVESSGYSGVDETANKDEKVAAKSSVMGADKLCMYMRVRLRILVHVWF